MKKAIFPGVGRYGTAGDLKAGFYKNGKRDPKAQDLVRHKNKENEYCHDSPLVRGKVQHLRRTLS